MSAGPAVRPDPDQTRSDFQRLVEAFQRSRRDLPWRQSRDPYEILVSEVMLQQTRVETVQRFYRPFLERFPTWEALAQASEEEVLTAWSGLGYYRRARNLRRTAQAVLALGGLPGEEERLRDLPGIGPYTAAALASIAFGRPALALDGNALRVLCRYFGHPGDPARRAVQRALTAWALPAIPERTPGDFTQGLMELGSQICRPTRPDCPGCPLGGGCRARLEGSVDRLPATRSRRPIREVRRTAAVILCEDRVLLVRNPDGQLLGGLWECPHVDGLPDAEGAAWIQAWLADRGLSAEVVELGGVRHAVTHHDIHARVLLARCPPGATRAARLREPDEAWIPAALLDARPLPSSTRQMLSLAAPQARPGPPGGRDPGQPRGALMTRDAAGSPP